MRMPKTSLQDASNQHVILVIVTAFSVTKLLQGNDEDEGEDEDDLGYHSSDSSYYDEPGVCLICGCSHCGRCFEKLKTHVAILRKRTSVACFE